MYKILGFCGSPRKGNSEYLLNQAMESIKARAEVLGEEVSIETVRVRGKKLSGCVMCQGCMKDGRCLIKDDFQALQDKWMEADVIIYSVPVYHMGIPAQLKAFIDRLGNSMFGRYKAIFGSDVSTVGKPLKVVGCIAQGIHTASGQEQTIIQMINHALITGCIPVSGDMWESYIGAGGWTSNVESRRAIEEQYDDGAEDARVLVDSSRSLATRAFDLAVLLRNGGLNTPKIAEESQYMAFAESLHK